MVAIPPLFIAVPLIAAESGFWPSLFSFTAAMALAVAWQLFRRGRFGEEAKLGLIQSAQLLIIAVGGVLILDDVNPASAILLFLTGVLLDWIVLRACVKDYARVMAMEESPERRANLGKPIPQEESDSGIIWGRIAARTCAAVACLFGFTLALVPGMGWIAGERDVSVEPVALVSLLIAVAACVITLPVHAYARRQRALALGNLSPMQVQTAVYCSAVAGVSALIIGVSAMTSGHPVLPAAIAAVQALLIAAFAAECVSANGARLNLARFSGESLLVVCTAAAGVWGVAFWTLTVGVGSRENPVPFEQSIGACVIGILFTWLLVASSTATVYAAGGRTYRTQYAPMSNVHQDVALLGLMWLVTSWLPQTASAHLPFDTIQDHLTSVAIVLSGFIVIYVQSLTWILQNNDSHNGRESAKRGVAIQPYAEPGSSKWVRLGSLPERLWAYGRSSRTKPIPEAEVAALDGHTAVQNSIALILSFGTVLGFVVWGLIPTAQPNISPE